MKESIRRVVLIGSYIYQTHLWLDYRFVVKDDSANHLGRVIGSPVDHMIQGRIQGFVALIVLIVCFLVAHKAINWIFQKGE